MKRASGEGPWLPPQPPQYNVVLPSEKAYFQGLINLQGEPSVHIRIGDYSHVAKADSAIVIAKALLEQAEWAIKLADAWRAVIEDAKRADAEERLADGQTGEGADAGPGESPPAPEKDDEGAGATPGSRVGAAPADHLPAPAPDESCDIDDLPDCMVGGVHQPHCRHAGKPVGQGGNP